MYSEGSGAKSDTLWVTIYFVLVTVIGFRFPRPSLPLQCLNEERIMSAKRLD